MENKKGSKYAILIKTQQAVSVEIKKSIKDGTWDNMVI